ncbi:uncharacterized protein CC84DRAFT_1204726 [Paraphaeosphaeria sporulosa]|uniref:Galactose oxidase n=1 Tax=Paraphaeosphaeria sporulosa TaxID=1460663 RepID=A0A177CJZ0_9PLEO|nr:uncharacterized protein CC84DRAFT_1204726 [Paraphaeosphaeria sporulosa]OAG07150.1 hypothetical protein CC84DRAFT_1204726 [Paraphaeosphaeria sporulosa]
MPAMASIRLSLLVAVAFVSRSLQAKDPISDFCRRWGHQTAHVDNKLYIDGGQVVWNPISTNPLNYTNTWLLYSDLNSTTQGFGQPYQYANLTKNSTVPSVSGGVLWADDVNKCFYQFGGEYQSNPSDFSFWTYDTRLNLWNETDYKSNVQSLQRVAHGAGTQAQDFGFGYYFGGYMNNLTSPNWKGGQIATSNLISYDFTVGQLNNNSGPPDNYGRAEGQLVHLPASDGGLLVYFGGIEDPTRNGSSQAANMSTIHIYDISSNKWYTQQASGDIPGARRQFCAGATWADDQSSYNIYLYGGFAAEGPGGYDDAYILSLPSFKWINVFSTGNGTTPFPHGACSANVINRDQMLIIGGWFTNSSYTDCDAPNSQGQHNMNLGYNGEKNVLWDKWDPSATKYFVPTPVISVIGGGPTGGATLTKPSKWDNGDLSVYFGRQATFSARSATRIVPSGTALPSETGSSKKTNVGAIAGGVVGGLAALILILSLILFCLHRRKKSLKAKEEKNHGPSPPLPVELAATSPVHEMHSPGAGKYMSLQQQPDPPMQSHSRSLSDDYLNPNVVSPYHPQFPSNSPTSTATHPSPYNTEFSHPSYAQQDQHAAYAQYPNTYDTQSYDPNSYHQPPGIALQREHSYPTPTSPSHPHAFVPVTQQVYYPPPPDPSTRTRSHQSHHSQTSYSDRVTSPEGTQFSGSDRHTRSPPSTTQTPAQFYAQPVPVRGPHVMSGGNLAPGGFGDEAGSINDSGSVRSWDSRKRPVRGRFVEVDDL